MSTQELRKEIYQVIERLPEETLSNLLFYLKGLEQLEPAEENRMKLFQKIIQEDANLLHRLAQ